MEALPTEQIRNEIEKVNIEDLKYFLRSPNCRNAMEVRTNKNEPNPNKDDNFYVTYANVVLGIRPAFYLNETTAQILSGSGTEGDPYVIDGKGNLIGSYNERANQ